jgi:hypothetical protein
LISNLSCGLSHHICFDLITAHVDTFTAHVDI